MSTQFRSPCTVACALDIVGDRWTLVVLRTIFAGYGRYGQLLKAPEGISTNILADRLAKLEAEGLVTKRVYQERPRRYEYALTPKGADLLPVLQALALWAGKHIPETYRPPKWLMDRKPEDFLPPPEASA